MANTTIIDLPTLTSPTADDVFPVVNDDITKKISLIDALNTTSIATTTPNFVYVTTSDNVITNGTNLLKAYTKAKTLSPNGLPLSSSNRATLILMPGTYDLGSFSLNLDTQYVDVVGFSRDASHVNIISNNSDQTINQSANDIRCIGFTIKNNGSGISAIVGSNFTNLYWENIIFDMLYSFNVSGTFVNCSGTNSKNGQGSFGGNLIGTFINCSGSNIGNNGGAGGFAGSSAILSGTFTNCKGISSGSNSGGGFAGSGSTLSGTFTNCSGSNSCDNGGGGFGGDNSIIQNAVFTNCSGSNSGSGGGGFVGINGGVSDSIFYNCQGFNYGLAGGGFVGKLSISIAGTFYNCTGSNTATWGGGFFGYQTSNNAYLNACKGSSSVSDGYAISGYLSNYKGQYINCIVSDQNLPTLTNSRDLGNPACFVNCIDLYNRLVNGSA